MNPIPIIIWSLLTVGCFSLCGKAFTEKGLPMTKTKSLKGTAGKIIGLICGILGVGCIVCLGIIIKMGLRRSGM